MKKLLFILFAALFSISVSAQSFNGKIDRGGTYTKANLGSTGFTLTNADTVDVTVTVNQASPFSLDVTMKLDSVSGDPTGTLYVLGRKDSDLEWSAIGNTVWDTNDETVIYSDTTKIRYRELFLRYINGGTGVTKALNYSVKVWPE